MHRILAEKEGIGQVVVCPRCSDVHVSCGRMSFRLPQDAFHALAQMLQSAAAHPALAPAQGSLPARGEMKLLNPGLCLN